MAIAPGTTILDYAVPARRTSRVASLGRDGLLIVSASILMALAAHIGFYLPFTPVPITLQTFMVLLVGAALGSKRGALVMLLYIAEGAVGLPVFASGGSPASLIGITAGYIWAFPIAAFVVGWLCERGLDRSYLTSIFAMLPAVVINLGLGVIWLAVFGLPMAHGVNHSLSAALLAGAVPFLPGEAFKMIVAAALLPTAWAIVRRVRKEQES